MHRFPVHIGMEDLFRPPAYLAASIPHAGFILRSPKVTDALYAFDHPGFHVCHRPDPVQGVHPEQMHGGHQKTGPAAPVYVQTCVFVRIVLSPGLGTALFPVGGIEMRDPDLCLVKAAVFDGFLLHGTLIMEGFLSCQAVPVPEEDRFRHQARRKALRPPFCQLV